ncbi:MAG: serine/threonine-protein phosphatase [Lachnospiraceae bacterium]|nr:serine/threonine-protein phosphatase [Lachnospiraceae bacterium]
MAAKEVGGDFYDFYILGENTLGYLDLKTGNVRVANAGHNPPILIHDGKAEYVRFKPGLMLAMYDDIRYNEQALQLQKGDVLYLYTDDVTEAMDVHDNLYGEDRLKDLLSYADRVPEPDERNGLVGSICKMVTADVTKYTIGAEQSDDITMLCIRYL